MKSVVVAAAIAAASAQVTTSTSPSSGQQYAGQYSTQQFSGQSVQQSGQQSGQPQQQYMLNTPSTGYSPMQANTQMQGYQGQQGQMGSYSLGLGQQGATQVRAPQAQAQYSYQPTATQYTGSQSTVRSTPVQQYQQYPQTQTQTQGQTTRTGSMGNSQGSSSNNMGLNLPAGYSLPPGFQLPAGFTFGTSASGNTIQYSGSGSTGASFPGSTGSFPGYSGYPSQTGYPPQTGYSGYPQNGQTGYPSQGSSTQSGVRTMYVPLSQVSSVLAQNPGARVVGNVPANQVPAGALGM